MGAVQHTHSQRSRARLDETFADRFDLGVVLGRGGSGIVYAGRHRALDIPVAIKFLREHEDDELAARFLREGRAAARLRSPHIVRVLDLGRTEDGTPFLVMELAHGEQLNRVISRDGPLPWERVATFAIQLCDALAVAHRAGVIHRDVKPANVIVSHDDTGAPLLQLIDFGISRLVRSADEQITHRAQIIGSPAFTAPEQFDDPSDVDPRADLWSLGATMFFLLTGEPPLPAKSLAKTLIRLATEDAPDVRTVRPEVPEAMSRIVARCLQRDRASRFARAADLAEELRALFVPRKEPPPAQRLSWLKAALIVLAAVLLVLLAVARP